MITSRHRLSSLPALLVARDNDIPGVGLVEDLATSVGQGYSKLGASRDDPHSKVGNVLGLSGSFGVTLLIWEQILVSEVIKAHQTCSRETAQGFTYIVAPEDCRMAALEILLALSLSACCWALTQVEAVTTELAQSLLCCSRHWVRGEAEDIAVGIGPWDFTSHH